MTDREILEALKAEIKSLYFAVIFPTATARQAGMLAVINLRKGRIRYDR